MKILRHGVIPMCRGAWDNFVLWVDPDDLDPPNEPSDDSKLALLTGAMQTQGWTKEPLLVMISDHGVEVLCGSHRIEAARKAKIPVPVLIVCVSEGEPSDESANVFDEVISASRRHTNLHVAVLAVANAEGHLIE